ncbi:DUF6164 family protein [Nitrosomonas sp. Nm132]|uniref:DUF6164 family protein n=1 Tax=Nitrosomonas sp. Nm132 TaxID=1881053 RepID=UPI00088B55F5|nr:DUF6164 family protein [Nitrosomonas sp. Nm132]SDH38517.1 hypothetical protein SAMN05428952_101237 [Nitrosomonas sp. Nm132]
MSKILFRLRNIPDDEVEEVRELLASHHIDYYETSAGNWGVSMPALWVRDEHQYQEAKKLLDNYQEARSIRVREEYARLKREGKNKTVLDSLKENPVLFIAYILIVLILLYLPFKLIMEITTL